MGSHYAFSTPYAHFERERGRGDRLRLRSLPRPSLRRRLPPPWQGGRRRRGRPPFSPLSCKYLVPVEFPPPLFQIIFPSTLRLRPLFLGLAFHGRAQAIAGRKGAWRPEWKSEAVVKFEGAPVLAAAAAAASLQRLLLIVPVSRGSDVDRSVCEAYVQRGGARLSRGRYAASRSKECSRIGKEERERVRDAKCDECHLCLLYFAL